MFNFLKVNNIKKTFSWQKAENLVNLQRKTESEEAGASSDFYDRSLTELNNRYNRQIK